MQLMLYETLDSPKGIDTYHTAMMANHAIYNKDTGEPKEIDYSFTSNSSKKLNYAPLK